MLVFITDGCQFFFFAKHCESYSRSTIAFFVAAPCIVNGTPVLCFSHHDMVTVEKISAVTWNLNKSLPERIKGALKHF